MSTEKKSQRPAADEPDPQAAPVIEPPKVPVSDPIPGEAIRQGSAGGATPRAEEPASASGTPVHNDGTPLQPHQVRPDGTPGAEPPIVESDEDTHAKKSAKKH